MAETRESVILDIALLTRFATFQRFKDVNNSAFSRSRVDADLSAFRHLRNPSMPTLTRGFLDSHFDPVTSKGNQRSEEILNAFATIFAGSGDCVAVGVIRDLEKGVIQMIIAGNGNISRKQRQQIQGLYVGLKDIAAASERTVARQSFPTDLNGLEDSPPAKLYRKDLPCVTANQKFQAMVIQHCIKKIAKRFTKYGRLFDHVDDYLSPILRERHGIEKYIGSFQQLKPVIVRMFEVPAMRKDVKWLGFVLFGFHKLHLARNEINFEALNDELLKREHLYNQTQPQIRDRLRLSRSFNKLLITRDSATVLTKMALSPHLRPIFLDFKFEPIYLQEEKGLVPSTDVNLWMRRFETMSISGSRSEEGEQTQGGGGARGSEDVEETRGAQDGEEIGSIHSEQTYGSQGSGRARGSEDVEEIRGSQDGGESRFKDSEQPRGSQGSGGDYRSEDVEKICGSKDGGETRLKDGEQTCASKGSGGARVAGDAEETRGSQNGKQNVFGDSEHIRGSQVSEGPRGSQDVELTRGSQDGKETRSKNGEETRKSEDGEETGSKNGEVSQGSENGRQPRRPDIDIRSELMDCIKDAISLKANDQVHAEVKILGYLHRHGLIDKAINSIGINKLCCPVCLCYISVLDIPIQVSGNHNKWYPWHLCPNDKLLSLNQLRSMKAIVLRDFKLDWMKHLSALRQRSLSFGNHSESSSGDAQPADGIDVFIPSYDDDKVNQEEYYDDDKFMQGEYFKELEESMEYSVPNQFERSIQT